EGVEEGILKGMYRFRKSGKQAKHKAHLFGSGSILNEALKAAEILEADYDVSADVWSVTSYKNLHRDALDTERWNMLHPDEPKEERRVGKRSRAARWRIRWSARRSQET